MHNPLMPKGVEHGHATIQSTEIYVQAVAAVPEDCLVHLDHVSMVPEPGRLRGCQLRLYDPAAG